MGEHLGPSFYTLGQRKGTGIGALKAHRNAGGADVACGTPPNGDDRLELHFKSLLTSQATLLLYR